MNEERSQRISPKLAANLELIATQLLAATSQKQRQRVKSTQGGWVDRLKGVKHYRKKWNICEITKNGANNRIKHQWHMGKRTRHFCMVFKMKRPHFQEVQTNVWDENTINKVDPEMFSFWLNGIFAKKPCLIIVN